jgi:hypothetical protein
MYPVFLFFYFLFSVRSLMGTPPPRQTAIKENHPCTYESAKLLFEHQNWK